MCFQFIWIPTESGLLTSVSLPQPSLVSNLYGSRQSRDNHTQWHAFPFDTRFQFIWIPTESGRQTLRRPGIWSLFPIYMDPDRVGTRVNMATLKELKEVSNLYGSRQSRDATLSYSVSYWPQLFPIYMDPDRVGTSFKVEPGEGQRKFPIYMDPDRVGTREIGYPCCLVDPVSNLYGSRQSRDC